MADTELAQPPVSLKRGKVPSALSLPAPPGDSGMVPIPEHSAPSSASNKRTSNAQNGSLDAQGSLSNLRLFASSPTTSGSSSGGGPHLNILRDRERESSATSSTRSPDTSRGPFSPELVINDQLQMSGFMGSKDGRDTTITVDKDNTIVAIDENVQEDALKQEEDKIEELMGITMEFENRLRLFKYLLLASGLHVHSPKLYVWFLRTVVWSCTGLCLMNLVMQTRAYRHPLFDIILVMLHVWVSVQYEYWRSFMRTTHWKAMMDLVTRHGSGQFSRRVAVIGYLACITVPGATAAISFGWLAPIFSSMIGEHGTGPSNDVWYGFLFSHGALMVIIVFPWACVCLAGVFLFHLVVLAHTTDLEVCLADIRKLVRSSITSRYYNSPVDLFQVTRERLRITCAYFSWVYAAAIGISLLMILCGGINLAWRIMTGSESRGSDHLNSDVPDQQLPDDTIWQYIQDLFYAGLGCIALYCALFTTVKLSHHWDKFLQILDDFPTEPGFRNQFAEGTVLSYHFLVVQYLRRTQIGYYVFNIRMTMQVCWNIMAMFILVTGVIAVSLIQITSQHV